MILTILATDALPGSQMPTITTIANIAGVSPKTVMRSFPRLKAASLIRVRHCGAYRRNRYTLTQAANELFAKGKVELHHEEPINFRQISTSRNESENGQVLIESKEKTKNRLDLSPDRTDVNVTERNLGKQLSSAEKSELRNRRRERHRRRRTFMSA